MTALPVPASPLGELGHLPLFAHHPTCARHDHHLLRPFGVAVCLGCLGMWTGIVLGTLGLVVAGLLWSGWVFFALSLLAYAPTFGQPFVQRRWYKLPARLLLGVGFALGAASLLVADLDVGGWVFRALVIVTTYGLYRAATTLRHQKTPDPCRGCPWGAFPLCAHNLPRLRELRDSTQDLGQRAFLSSLVDDLQPLATIPPNFLRIPVREGGTVAFVDVPTPRGE